MYIIQKKQFDELRTETGGGRVRKTYHASDIALRGSGRKEITGCRLVASEATRPPIIYITKSQLRRSITLLSTQHRKLQYFIGFTALAWKAEQIKNTAIRSKRAHDFRYQRAAIRELHSKMNILFHHF